MYPLIESLENCKICFLPNDVAKAWLKVTYPQKGHYSTIDQTFDLPGVGETPLAIYRDFQDNYYLIHEPV